MLFFRFELQRRGIRSSEEFLPPYRAAAADLGLSGVEPARKTFEGWFYEGRRPQKAFRPAIVKMLGYSIDVLWTEVPEGATPDFAPLVGTSLAQHAEPGMDMSDMKRSGTMAVRRARQYVYQTDRERVGDSTIPLLHDQVARLVRDYPRVPLSLIWDDLLDTQDQVIFNLETGKHRPSQLGHLNFMAGVLSFLVAKGFNDMEDREQARTMSLLAAAFAKDAEHPGLIALIHGLQSLIEYWADRPGDALFYAQKGTALATNPLNGTVGLWLLGLQARAAAVLGDEETARTAHREAFDLRGSVVQDDLDELGGLLTYSMEKQNYYTVEAEVLLGHGDTVIAAQAEQAVQGFTDPEAPNWAFGDLAGAQCNLALVLLHSGELDGAAQAIRPVLDLPSSFRNNGIIVSAHRVRQVLMTSPTRTAAVARDLREEIAVFAPRRPALPSGTHR